MADSDEEYERKKCRDKFRKERDSDSSDYHHGSGHSHSHSSSSHGHGHHRGSSDNSYHNSKHYSKSSSVNSEKRESSKSSYKDSHRQHKQQSMHYNDDDLSNLYEQQRSYYNTKRQHDYDGSQSQKRLRKTWLGDDGFGGGGGGGGVPYSSYYQHDTREDYSSYDNMNRMHHHHRNAMGPSMSPPPLGGSGGGGGGGGLSQSPYYHHDNIHQSMHHHQYSNPYNQQNMGGDYYNHHNNKYNDTTGMMMMMPQHRMNNHNMMGNNNNSFEYSNVETQPPMMSFKSYIQKLNQNLTPEQATKRYNDYKNNFRKEQIEIFFNKHKNEEWFKLRYHPIESNKRKLEQQIAIKRRLKIFMNLYENGWLDNVYADMDNYEKFKQFLDAITIRLEDENNDLKILDHHKEQQQQQQQQKPDQTTTTTNDVELSEEKSNEKEMKNDDDNQLERKNSNNDSKINEEEEKIDDNNEENEKGKQVNETIKTSNDDDSDKESGMCTDSSDGEEIDDDGDANGNDDKAIKKIKEKKKEKTSTSDSNNTVNNTNNNNINNTDANGKLGGTSLPVVSEVKIPPLNQSVFFKNLPVATTRKDLEDIAKKLDGYKRLAISEPAPDKGFQRRAWITYDTNVDIKEICKKISEHKICNNFTLNPTVNREIEQKVRTVSLLSNHKTIIKNDLKQILKIVNNMDKRWGLWEYENESIIEEQIETSKSISENEVKKDEENNDNCEENEKEKEENTDNNTDIKQEKQELDESKNDESKEFGEREVEEEVEIKKFKTENETNLNEENNNKNETKLLLKNPLLENINEYLVEEMSAEEEELLGNANNGTAPTATTGSGSSNSVVNSGGNDNNPNALTKIERDDKAALVLDRLILYLRIVHSIDYYNTTEYQQEDWMPNRCGVIHIRSSIKQNNEVKKVKKCEIDDWLKLFEMNIKQFVDYKDKIDDDVAKRLGYKDEKAEIERFINDNCQEIEKDKWLCPLSGKKFKAKEYVHKHIYTKHQDKIDEIKINVKFFNQFLYDPKRPYLPEHPLTKLHNGNNNNNNMNGGNLNMNSNNNNNYQTSYFNDNDFNPMQMQTRMHNQSALLPSPMNNGNYRNNVSFNNNSYRPNSQMQTNNLRFKRF